MLSVTRGMALSIGILGISFFAGALLWEHVGNATPCIMCYIERWFFLGAGIIGVCAAYAKRELSTQRLLGVTGFVFIATSVVLFRHMGTQYKWFKVPGICRASRPLSEMDLSEQLLSPIPQVTCDQIEFTIWGQPPTFYLFCVALTLVILCFWGFLRETPMSQRSFHKR